MQPDANGRTHHPGDLHMTLVFLGDLDEPVEAVASLAGAAEMAPFSMELRQFAYWSRPKVLVLQPNRCPEPLQMLVASLQNRMRDGGLSVDTRPYKPHVTLARKAKPIKARYLEESIVWPVEDYCLFVSDWSGAPPHYQVLDRWPLSGTV